MPITQTQTIARYQNGGRVVKFSVGTYNSQDITDLENIAKIKAHEEGVTVQILPAIESVKDPNYAKLFPELIGTEYEGKCPDFRIITQVGDKFYVEYESFERGGNPFTMRKVEHMLKHGARQASNIVIDVRGTTVTHRGVKDRVDKLKRQKSFKSKIDNVWIYDGNRVERAYKSK